MEERPLQRSDGSNGSATKHDLAMCFASIDTSTIGVGSMSGSPDLAQSTGAAWSPALESTETWKNDSHLMNPKEDPRSTTVESRQTRKRAFAPLPGLVGVRPSNPVFPVRKPLSVPKVVSQILEDVPEHWKSLAQGIEARVKHDGLKTLLVTSKHRGEGATTVATALALAVAEQTDLRVLLVDLDLAHPSLGETLGLRATLGFEHHLIEKIALESVVASCEKPNLKILPTQNPLDVSSIAKGSERLTQAVEDLQKTYDLVILDCGSLLERENPKPLPEGIDATLIVRDPSKSNLTQLDELDRHLARLGICSLGVIENCVDV